MKTLSWGYWTLSRYEGNDVRSGMKISKSPASWIRVIRCGFFLPIRISIASASGRNARITLPPLTWCAPRIECGSPCLSERKDFRSPRANAVASKVEPAGFPGWLARFFLPSEGEEGRVGFFGGAVMCSLGQDHGIVKYNFAARSTTSHVTTTSQVIIKLAPSATNIPSPNGTKNRFGQMLMRDWAQAPTPAPQSGGKY